MDWESVWMWMVESGGDISRASSAALASGLVDEALPQTLYPMVSCVSGLYYAAPIIGSAALVLLSASDPSV